MLNKFGIYDFVATVIPGVVTLWVLTLLLTHFGASRWLNIQGNFLESTVFLSLSYITGLVLQGISQGITEKLLIKKWNGFPSARWLMPNNDRFSGQYKANILMLVEKKFGIRIEDNLPDGQRMKRNQEIFYICYNAVDKLKQSDRPEIFNAQYGLFRCLLTMFTAVIILSTMMFVLTKDVSDISMIGLLVFSVVGAIVSYFRVKKRGEDFAKTIYDLFLVSYSDKESHRV
jgi:hypothetical protein